MSKSGEKVAGNILGCVVVLILIAAIAFGGAWLLMWAWNAVVPALLHGPVVNYWQAFAGSVLLTIIGNHFRSSSSSTLTDPARGSRDGDD